MSRLFLGPPRTPFDDPREAESAARFGMWLFLIALAALFAATLLGYVVMYVQLSAAGRWPDDLPRVPGGLVLSTVLLVVTSIGLERAARGAQRMAYGRPDGAASVGAASDESGMNAGAGTGAGAGAGAAEAPVAAVVGEAKPDRAEARGAELAAGVDRVRRDLSVASLLGAAFLLLQAFAWIAWLLEVDDRLADATTYRFALTGFWVLTGLHALHVLGGILPLGLETWLAWRRPSTDVHRAGAIRFSAMYWHFLGVIWLLLYGLLLVTI